MLGLQYKSFLLSVATLEPRKNLLRLVEAYTQLPENIRNDFPLVLVGDSGWKNTELFEKTAELFWSTSNLKAVKLTRAAPPAIARPADPPAGWPA